MENRTGDVGGVADGSVEPGVDSVRPMALNRRMRRALMAQQRRKHRRFVRAAHRELKLLARLEKSLGAEAFTWLVGEIAG